MSYTLARRFKTKSVLLPLLAALSVMPVSALQVKKHTRHEPTIVNGRIIPSDELKLENDPRYKGPHLLSSQSAAENAKTPDLTAYQRRIAPTVQSMRAKALAQRAAGAHPAATPKRQAASGPAVNFPGFNLAPTVAAGLLYDTAIIYSSIEMDVNKDGKPDIVDVQSDGAISVHLNPGTGKFSDFKVTSTNSTAINIGVAYSFAETADVNGDGYPDLIALDVVNNAAFVYLNMKDGTFADPQEYDFTFASGATFGQNGGTVLAFDTNGDQVPDLVAVSVTETLDANGNGLGANIAIEVALGNGDGTFGEATEQDTALSGIGSVQEEYGNVVAADMNGDGKIDLVIPFGTYTSTDFSEATVIAVGINKGDGTFSGLPTAIRATGVTDTGVYSLSGNAAVADVNGDGIPDVIFNAGVPGIYLALGNGDGTVQNPKMVLAQPGTSRSGAAGPINYADVNGDGNIDVISYNLGFVSVYLGDGKGVFNSSPSTQLVSGSTASQQPAPVDYTGDGKADIVAVDAFSQTLGLFAGDGKTFAGPSAMAPAGEPAQNFEVQAVGDFNGDGYPDVVAQSYYNSIDGGFAYNFLLGLNDGKGNFTYTTIFTSAQLSTAGAGDLLPFAADFDGDGKLDIMFTASFYNTTQTGPFIALNNGDGTFAVPTPIPLGVTTTCALDSFDIGDVNGDGRPDIIATYDGDSNCYANAPGIIPSSFFVFLNAGGGNFTPSNYPFGYELYQPKLTDLNDDGKLDLVLSDVDTNDNLFYLYDIPGNGDGTFNFGGSQQLLDSTFVSAIIPGDFDGDGKQDLALGVLTQVDSNGNPVANTTGDYIMKGNGDFTFQLPVQYASGTYAVSGQAADFNGDGRPDLALAEVTFDDYTDIQTGNFVTLINEGAGAFTQAPIAFTANSLIGQVFVNDFNDDGGLDTLVSVTSDDPASPYNRGLVTEQFLNRGGVTATLTASASALPQSTALTLTVTLSPALSQSVPTGTMTFYNGGIVLGIVPVSNNTVTLAVAGLPVGTNVVYASYSGDSNFNTVPATNSLSIAVTALAPAFTLSAATPTSLSVVQGQTAAVAIGLTTNATFTGTISFTCTGAPFEASCTIFPGSVTINGAQTTTLTAIIATTAPNDHSEAKNHTPIWLQTPGGIAFATFFVLLPLRRRKFLSKWLTLTVVFLALGASLTIIGCGGGPKYAGTPAGTSTLTVTATSGSLTQSTIIALKTTH